MIRRTKTGRNLFSMDILIASVATSSPGDSYILLMNTQMCMSCEKRVYLRGSTEKFWAPPKTKWLFLKY